MFITFEGGEGAGKTTQAARLEERLRAAGHATQLTCEPGGTPLANAFRALLLTPNESLVALSAAGLLAPGAGGDVETANTGGADAPAAPAAEPMLPLTEALLFSAARAQHVARINEWLAAGLVVISDRYADATLAYQGDGRGYDKAILKTLEAMATGGLRPTITFLLDLPAVKGSGRKGPNHKTPEPTAEATPAPLQLSMFDHPVTEGQRRKLRVHDVVGGEWNRLDRETLDFHQRVREGYRALAAAEPDRWVVLDATIPMDELADRIWQAVAPRLA